jgi:FkbM family methyltransferase
MDYKFLYENIAFSKLGVDDQRSIVRSIDQHIENILRPLKDKADLKQTDNQLFKFEKYVRAILVNAHEGLFLVDPEDDVIGYSLRNYGNSSSDQVNYLLNFIEERHNVLVVGAHIGTLAIPIAKECKSVVAIEANPYTFELLRLNICLNQIQNCSIFNFAANHTKGKIKFLLNRKNSGGSKRRPVIPKEMYYYDHPKEIDVEAERLDEHFPEENFEIIIMDIEGSEYYALNGMPKLLERCSVLVIEFLPHHLKYVAGISIEDLFNSLPDFRYLIVPSLKIKAKKNKILRVLSHMFENNLEDENLIFIK